MTPASSTTCTAGSAAVAGDGVGQPGLAEAAGADDRHHPGAGQQRPQPLQVTVAADQRGRVVADAPADRPVKRQQAAVRPLEQLAGIGAEPVAQVPLVARESLKRRRRATDGGLAAQQVRQQRLVLRPLRVRRLERGQRVRVRPGPAGRPRQDQPGAAASAAAGARTSASGPGVAVAHPGQAAVSSRASRASAAAAAASRSSAAARVADQARTSRALSTSPGAAPSRYPAAVADDRLRDRTRCAPATRAPAGSSCR